MFGLGMPELIVIFIIVFLLFGAKRLPEIAKGLGKSINTFKQGLKDTEKEISADDKGKEENGPKDS